MPRPFHLLQEDTYVVVIGTGIDAHILGAHSERLDGARLSPQRQAPAQRLVHNLLDWLSSTPCLGLELLGNILVERQGCSHIMML